MRVGRSCAVFVSCKIVAKPSRDLNMSRNLRTTVSVLFRVGRVVGESCECEWVVKMAKRESYAGAEVDLQG